MPYHKQKEINSNTLLNNMNFKSLVTLLFISHLSFVIAQEVSGELGDGISNAHNLFSAIDNDDVSCYRIPALITANNGDLLVAIDERIPSCGDLKWSEDINIVLRKSTDNGVSWLPIERIIDFPLGKSASDPSFILDKITGAIFMFYNYMDLKNEKDVYYLHVVKSTDNGKTWSQPEDITSQITKPEWHGDFKFITSGRGIQTSTGKLLHCMVNLDNGMHLFGSDDHGKTWKLYDVPIKPANESKIVELNDGRWMINSRVNGQGLRYVHFSDDEGKTWESHAEETLIDPSCNASIIQYDFKKKKKGTPLIFANANSKDKRENMTVRISFDNGTTWSKGKTIYTGGSAYSTLTVLKNGDIGLCFEKDNYKENVFVSFKFDWLLED